MTTYQIPLVVGVFEEEQPARSAVDALRNAGFRYDQVGVAIRNEEQPLHNLRDDLITLGVDQEQANHYDDAYKSGEIVVSVRPDGRNTEAQHILSDNGATDCAISNDTPLTQAPSTQTFLAESPVDQNQPDTEPINHYSQPATQQAEEA